MLRGGTALYRILSIAVALAILVGGGCTGQYKTKEALYQEGMKKLEVSDLGSAVIFFKNALEKDPNYFEARFQLAKVYYSAGKLDAAEREFQKVVRLRPSSREAHVEMARTYAHNGKPDEALKEIAGLGAGGDNDAEVMEIAAWARAGKSDYNTAVSLLKRSMNAKPGRTSAALMLAKVYFLKGSNREARTLTDQLLKTDPHNRDALYLLADMQAQEGNLPSAIATYDQLIQLPPADCEALFRKGKLYLKLGRYDEALASSDQIIRSFPNRVEGYELKGGALYYKKQFNDAIVMLQKAVMIRPSAGSYYVLGLSFFNSGELEQALSQLRNALDLNPKHEQARLLISLINLKKDKSDDAIAEIRKVIDGNPQSAAAHSILGSALLAKGMSAEGIAELNRAIALDPKFADARFTKGMFELSRGRTGEAETDLSAVVTINPELLNSRIMLASTYLRRSEYAKAVHTAQQGIRGKKTDAVLYNVIADVHMRQGRSSDAESALRKAKEADPGYAVTYFKLVFLHMLAGEQDKAIAELRTLADIAPDNAQALLDLAALLEMTGQGEEARTCYEKARRTGEPRAALETARYYLRLKEPGEAIAVLDEALRKNPSAQDLLVLKGQTHLQQKKFVEAVDTYEKLARVNLTAGLAAVSDAYLAMNKPEKALDRVRRELKDNPGRLDLKALISRIYLLSGRQAEAAENARAMIKEQPGAALGYITLAIVFQDGKDIDKGIDVLKRAPKTRDVNIPMMLGRLYEMKKDYAAALGQYRTAETLQPGYVPALYQKGLAYHAWGKKNEAIAEYRRVVQLSQKHVSALNNLACLCVEDRGSRSEALQYAVQAYALAPHDGPVQDTLGYVLLRNGKAAESVKLLEQAAATLQNNPSVYYHLALAYSEREEKDAAVKYLQKALGLGSFPEQSQAKTLLARLNRGTGASARIE